MVEQRPFHDLFQRAAIFTTLLFCGLLVNACQHASSNEPDQVIVLEPLDLPTTSPTPFPTLYPEAFPEMQDELIELSSYDGGHPFFEEKVGLRDNSSYQQSVGYTAISERDPLGEQWHLMFYRVHNRSPDERDRFLRLFSIAFPDEWDWDLFYDSNGDVKSQMAQEIMTEPPKSRNWRALPTALLRLASFYGWENLEEIVRDTGTLFAGLPDRFSASENKAITGCDMGFQCRNRITIPAQTWVYLRPEGLPIHFTRNAGDANVHHWAWSVSLGYSWGASNALMMNTFREVQQVTDPGRKVSSSETWADLLIGSSGAVFGSGLSTIDRLLQYVHAGGTFVNGALVARGWAQAVDYPPDTDMSGVHHGLAAQGAGIGRSLSGRLR